MHENKDHERTAFYIIRHHEGAQQPPSPAKGLRAEDLEECYFAQNTADGAVVARDAGQESDSMLPDAVQYPHDGLEQSTV